MPTNCEAGGLDRVVHRHENVGGAAGCHGATKTTRGKFQNTKYGAFYMAMMLLPCGVSLMNAASKVMDRVEKDVGFVVEVVAICTLVEHTVVPDASGFLGQDKHIIHFVI